MSVNKDHILVFADFHRENADKSEIEELVCDALGETINFPENCHASVDESKRFLNLQVVFGKDKERIQKVTHALCGKPNEYGYVIWPYPVYCEKYYYLGLPRWR